MLIPLANHPRSYLAAYNRPLLNQQNPKKPNSIQSSAFPSLASLCKSGKIQEALLLLESSSPTTTSTSTTTELDLETYSLLLHTCITKRSLPAAQKLHHHLLHSNKNASSLYQNPILKSKLITLYSVCGRIGDARRVFDDCETLDQSVWAAMLTAYSRNGFAEEALLLYTQMLYSFVLPGNFAFSSVLKACSDLMELRLGKVIHGQIFKCKEWVDQVVNNGLLVMYSKCQCFDAAVQVFDEMPQRNVVSWNALLASLVDGEFLVGVLEYFRRMQKEKELVVGFNWVTLTTVLTACGRLTALQNGREIHARIVKEKSKPDLPVLNSLLDMYARCGMVQLSRQLFDKMPERDLASWNVMFAGYAINGQSSKSLELLDEMVAVGFRPNDVTFISVLSSCSHGGSVTKGREIFDRMKKDFGVSPTIEHYACMVDLLGRAGLIEEAVLMVQSMPMSPSNSIWGSLLNSCRIYGKIELGEIVAKRLFELEPKSAGNYVMLSNIYAAARRWEDVERVRGMMAEREIRKEAGCSWLWVKNKIHMFVAGGSVSFRSSIEYQRVWGELKEAMEEAGYFPDTSVVLHDAEEERKAIWVCGHSEKIAIVFGLIHSNPSMPIRVTKNLRVCIDCHEAIKIISRIARRVIILRDTNRFHHFENGICSCGDFW